MNSDCLQAKWQDYLFLTREMHKFLLKPDMDLFHALLAQRVTLQKEIQALSADNQDYNSSPEGQALIREIQLADQEMQRRFCQIFNNAKKHREVSQAYEGASYGGRFINRNT